MEREAKSKGTCGVCGQEMFRRHRVCENKANGVIPVEDSDILDEGGKVGLGDSLERLRRALMDEAKIRRWVREEVEAQPARVLEVVNVDDAVHAITEPRHAKLETLIKMLAAKVPVAIHGPCGTGKSYGAKQAAEALGLPFYCESVCAQSGKHDFAGFIDANGRPTSTLLKRAVKEGGIYCLDEADAGNANVQLLFNQLLSALEYPFPGEASTKAAPTFGMVATLNTTGSGKTTEYVGRNALDLASRDRYAWLWWPIDEALELQLSINKDWTRYVQRVRAALERAGIKNALVSPRSSLIGAKLLAAGLSVQETIAARMGAGLTPEGEAILASVEPYRPEA